MAGKKRLTPLEEFTTVLDNARTALQVLAINPREKERLVARIDRLEIDTKKELYTQGAPQKVVIIDRLSGEMKTVEGYKAALTQWRAKDKDSYTAFEDAVQDFMSQFSDSSMFVQMFGRKAEKLLPEAIGGNAE